MKQRLHILALIFIILSCNREKPIDSSRFNTELYISIKDNMTNVKSTLSDHIKIDSIITLENRIKNAIGKIDKVIFTDSIIYILDKRIAKKIFCYDTKGRYIGSFFNLGKGNNQYTHLHDISLYNNQIHVLVNKNRVIILDQKLHFLKTKRLKWKNKITHFFHVINDNEYVFADADSKFKLSFYNVKEQKIGNQFFKTIGKDFVLPGHCSLQKNANNEILFFKEYNDTVYHITKDYIKPHVVIDFEKGLSIPEKEKLASTFFLDRKIPQDKMLRVSHFYEAENYIFFCFRYENKLQYVFYDKKNKSSKIFSNGIKDDLLDLKHLPFIIGMNGNSLIASVDSYKLVESNHNLHQIGKISKSSNPVLIVLSPNLGRYE